MTIVTVYTIDTVAIAAFGYGGQMAFRSCCLPSSWQKNDSFG